MDGSEGKKKDKVTIVLFSGELDKALAAFNIATTAAAMGSEVTMFFTFWGLNVIKTAEAGRKSSGFMRKLLNWMNRGGAHRLPLSKFHMFGIGTRMMKKLMRESKMPQLEELIEMARRLKVRFVACTTTCGLMDLTSDDAIPEVGQFAGAASYLGEARESTLNLFI